MSRPRRRFLTFLHGVGSVLNIAPAPDYGRYALQGSDALRLQGDLYRVGQDMKRAIRSTNRVMKSSVTTVRGRSRDTAS